MKRVVRRSLDNGAPTDDQAVHEQQNHRADDRADPAGGRLIASHECRGQEAADERACNAEENRDDPAARVATRQEELRDRADNQTEEEPSKDVN
jgi:hypothetical protein